MDDQNSPEIVRTKQKRNEKKKKATKLRKILKERLNIDCLRMLTS
jgi:hypothetical protein